ncbi:tyrosine-type recombinase/integrase [Microvirga makkahensis]|uniref:Tyrosine-type recombinase/integrase n=1 Tax=Microvirga makkahensis TaxID=1128670 RepID=A0A7X3MX40_9HYPH|nr:tyrosine-type recombinase/integrase [Microvirga makkahensis]MXQ14876.1 tyrosine-type recombinase/integrase [Microvirga makkahensis]
MQDTTADHPCRTNSPWNRGKLIGPKPPLKAEEIWSIRVRLQVAHRIRDLALFNLALDSKLRSCDLVALRVDDVALNGRVRSRATVMQRKTGQPVQFEITEQTREAVGRWLEKKDLHKGEPLFPSRINRARPMTTRQYARLLASWLRAIGLDPLAYGTHSLRRTKAAMIYRRTGNLRAVQLLLCHTKIESTVRYLGIVVDDALLIAEQVEI